MFNHVCYDVAEALIGFTLCIGIEIIMQISMHKFIRALRLGAIAFLNSCPSRPSREAFLL